ncbi:exonuclease [Pseudomonas phage Bjorn]|uniref:Exonuclease n=1 Tax=Pseudomonas phage Bjorn TaxID=2079288 RepID=A0A2K9VHE4_9CAUD|nr:exonuclease [Pseudomonas phage Bjorn]AUV61771.1 exonuclease [Pseudomonas phage Bjorn]
MSRPSRLLFDGDVLRYEIGAVCQSMEPMFDTMVVKPHSETRVREAVDAMVERVVHATDVESYEIFLSGSTNFRYDVAVTNPYKGQRLKSAKPYHWSTVGQILREDYGAHTVHGAEADDVLSIFGRQDPDNTVCASRDKDIRIVPCWHYAWKCGEKQPEIPVHRVTELGQIGFAQYPSGGYKLVGNGLKFFYAQILAGDDIDNYKGCPRIGPKAAADLLCNCNSEHELWEATYWAYHRKLGPEEGLRLLIENAQLAWLLDDAEVTYDANDIYISPKRLWQPPSPIPTGFSSGPLPGA